MKKALTLLVSVLLVLGSFSMVLPFGAAAVTNLLSNGDFSTVPAGTSFTDDAGISYPGRINVYSAGCNWYRATGGNGLAFDAYESFYGNNHAKIASNINQVVALTSNTTYTLSFRAYRDRVFFASSTLYIKFVDLNNGSADAAILNAGGTLTDQFGNSSTGTNTYVTGTLNTANQLFTFTFTTGTLSDTAQYALNLVASGYVAPTSPSDAHYWYLDDASLTTGAPVADTTTAIRNGNFQNSTGYIGAGSPDEINNISNDGDCMDGVTGHSDVADSRIAARPTTLTSAYTGMWYRASIGRTRLLIPDSVNAYSAIVQEAGNPTNHIAKIGQTVQQGVSVSPGKSYTLSFRLRVKQGITLPATAPFKIYFLDASSNAATSSYSMGLTNSSYTYTDDSGVTQTANSALSLLGNNTIQLDLKSIQNIVNTRWITVSCSFSFASATFTANQLLYLNFQSSTWSTTYGNASNFFEYMDDVSFGEYQAPTGVSLNFESGVNSTDALNFTTPLNSVASSTYTGVPSDCGNYIGSFTSATAYNNTTCNAGFNVTSGTPYQASCWINIKSATPGTGSYIGASIGVVNTKNSLGASSTSANATYTVYNADGTQKLTGKAGNNAGKSFCSLLTDNGLSFNTWYRVVMNYTTTADETNYFMMRTENITNATILIDNVRVQKFNPVNVSVDCKESAAVIPTLGVFTPNLGDTFSFRVLTADTAPVVTYNGTTLTPNSGVYSFTAGASNAIKVVCAGDSALPAAGHDQYGNNLTTYLNNSQVYLNSIWDSSITYQETALFYSGRSSVKLLYPIDEIVSLRSYDLQTYYVKGVDYNIVSGKIVLTGNTRIPVYGALTTTTDTGWASDVPGTYVNIIGDTTFPTKAICVTYKHSNNWSALSESGYTGTKPSSQSTAMENTLAKLAAGQPVNLVIFGDSISCGWSSSGLNNPASSYKVYNEDCTTLATTSVGGSYVINIAPYAPTWIDMFVTALKAKYPTATINVSNLSLGGKTAQWGSQQVATRLQKLCTAAPDLVLMGWGVNDAGSGCTAANFKTYCNSIISTVRNSATVNGNPNAEFLCYSPMIPNTTLALYNTSTLLGYESVLQDLADTTPSVGLVKLTSIFNDLGSSKEQVDYLNTNLNHPNDFGARIYATSLLAALSIEKPGYIGAAVRPVSANTSVKQGLRFTSSVAVDDVTNGSIVEFGTVAIRTARMAEGATLTLSTPNASHVANYIKDDPILYQPVLRTDNTDSTKYWFAAVLVNIPEQYYGSAYSIRSYVITDTGDIIYGDTVTLSTYNVVHRILTQAPQGSKDYVKAMTFVTLNPTQYDTWCQTTSNPDGY